VVRPDRVGDVVLSTPIYHTLKASFPNSFIGALVSPYTSPLLEQNPYIDAVITDEPTKDDFRMKEKFGSIDLTRLFFCSRQSGLLT